MRIKGGSGMRISTTRRLSNGIAMPFFGAGTYKLAPGRETAAAVAVALDCGYRLIDTASLYGNEADVAAALRLSGVRRDDVFITSKLWNDSHGYARSLAAFGDTLKRLATDYLDLYLIHWPASDLIGETWLALEKLVAEGYCRAIGVSNFTEIHLEALLAGCKIPPMVNQVEIHPFLAQRALQEWCEERDIAVQAYRSLLRGGPRDHPVIARACKSVGRTPSQILLRWALQRGLMVIPKSSRADRLRENAAVFDFELDVEQMSALDGLDAGMRLGPDPYSMP